MSCANWYRTMDTALATNINACCNSRGATSSPPLGHPAGTQRSSRSRKNYSVVTSIEEIPMASRPRVVNYTARSQPNSH